MPLRSKGSKARVWEVLKSTPTYQLVCICTFKKNPPTAKKEFKQDFRKLVFLNNNKTLVKKGDLIMIKAFEITTTYSISRGSEDCFAITDWELVGAYDYSNINIDYKGADDTEDE
jgi:hypothetical protein